MLKIVQSEGISTQQGSEQRNFHRGSKQIFTLQCVLLGLTSRTDIGGDENLLLAITKPLDDISSLHGGQLCCQHGHLVPVLHHLHREPACTPAGLRKWEKAELPQQLCICCSQPTTLQLPQILTPLI